MKIKIGLVDDHQLFIKSLSLMLQTLQHFEIVVEALNGEELLRKLQQMKELPELLLIDVSMPVMDGVETTKALQTTFPSIKLIALSMNDKDSAIISMFRAGCCAYLLKDVHPTSLEKALLQVYSKGYYNADAAKFNPARLFLQAEKETKINITAKEQAFLQLACSELTYKQIASRMGVSERTVDGYRETLFQKIGVQSRVGLCLEALRKGYVQL